MRFSTPTLSEAAPHPDSTVELSIVMPCLDEAETVATCIGKAHGFLTSRGIRGEVVVADNGSSDGSRDIARRHGARVLEVSERGYGNALCAGIAAARGRYVIMGDADDSYDFSSLDDFVAELRRGVDLVMGNRFRGGVLPGAMPWLHRRLGNPILSALGRLFFRAPVGDFHCGLRGVSKKALDRMELRASGMEFASEMVVKAALAGLRIKEVPVVLHPDGRTHAPATTNAQRMPRRSTPKRGANSTGGCATTAPPIRRFRWKRRSTRRRSAAPACSTCETNTTTSTTRLAT